MFLVFFVGKREMFFSEFVGNGKMFARRAGRFPAISVWNAITVKFAVNGFAPMTVAEKSSRFCWLFDWKVVILQADYYLQGNKSLEICVLIVPPLA